MKALYDLKDKLHMELEEIARKPEMGAGDLELVHKLTDTIKNIDKICALEEDGGYSQAVDNMDGYNRGNSYANRGKHYVRGHYSRDGYSQNGYSQNGYSRRDRRYSRDDGRDYMISQLEDMAEGASDKSREAIRRCIAQLETE